jgi:Alanine racemase, N-terminal domain
VRIDERADRQLREEPPVTSHRAQNAADLTRLTQRTGSIDDLLLDAPSDEPFAEAIVDLSAIGHNITAITGRTTADVMAVVKADAFGHGLIPVARARRTHYRGPRRLPVLPGKHRLARQACSGDLCHRHAPRGFALSHRACTIAE